MSGKQILLTMPPDIKKVVHNYMDEYLSSRGYTFKAVYSDNPLSAEELKKELTEIDGYIVGHEEVTGDVLDAAGGLKIVTKFGVGTDNIHIKEARERGIEVANCPGSNSNAVAELVVGLMLTTARNTQKLCEDLRRGHWAIEVGFELTGKKVGILGFGNIGRRVAEMLQPFTKDILVYDAFEDKAAEEKYGVTYTTLGEIAASCDFITVHLPLIPPTKNIINKEFFKKMKDGVFLVNAARGGIVNEDDLYDAVCEGKVARAALDVFEVEPTTNTRLVTDQRFVVLPHIGAGSMEATFNMAKMAMDNVIEVLEGRKNPNSVG